jgi:uncharacterized protein (TIGR02271 family)
MPAEEPSVERITFPLHEERLEPVIRDVETGRIQVHKRVEFQPVEFSVDTTRDDVTIERVRVDRPVDAVPEPRQEGDTLILPVVEEVVVTETRLIVREEIRITRRRVTETTPIHASVRREIVDIEEASEES